MHQKLGLVPSADTGEKRLVSESYAGGKLVEPNDLVLNRLKAHLGVFAYATRPGVISPDYTVLRPLPNAYVRYYEYLLKSPACRGELRTRTKGIVEGFWRLYTDDFYDIRLSVPPLDEQRLIVRFLDWHGAMTGKLIRAKRRLIALLNEQKQSIIHRAVTRGIDPAATLKPSGVDWLGDVPAHWEVRKVKWLFRYRKEPNTDGQENNILSLTMRGVVNNDPDNPIGLVPSDYGTYQIFEKGDLVFKLIDLENYRTSRVGIVPERGIMSPAYIRLEAAQPLCLQYFFLQFYDLYLRGVFNNLGGGVRATLSPTVLLNLAILMPPTDEQELLIAEIEQQTSAINRSIREIEAEIALVNEFRARLIADVVTGQLDVRAVAASLPDVAEGEAFADAPDDVDEDALDVETEDA